MSSSQADDSEPLATQVAAQIKEQLREREPGEFTFAPGDQLDDYEILAWVGGGNSGHVYRASDNRLSRTVALKVLKPDYSNSGLARLKREAKAVAAVSHEHIVGLFDVRLEAGPTPYLVMEWVAGGTVRQLVRSRGHLDCREAARIASQVAGALAAAHDQGLIHRDLKSANVLLSNTGESKLADFGLVRDLESDSNLTREHIVAGTPAYMAPEQIQDARNVDGRADLYSLGVMLYEMLTGELPFRGVERMVLHQSLHQDPKRPRLLNDQIHRDVETICLKCLAKSPQERYPTANELQADLDRFLAGEPIEARPIGLATVAWRWCRRNAALASALAVALLAVLSLTIGSTLAAIQLRSTSLTAQQNAALANRGRNHLQDTLRQLVFDVNEILDAEAVDLDEAQERLLVVAIDGLRKAAELGEGAQDESSAASKNRLARVLFRLDRDAEAEAYFQEALEETETLIASGYQSQPIWTEKLYALQGLQSIADYEEQTELADSLQTRIDVEIPSNVLDAFEEQQLGTTWLDELSWISESEPEVAASRLCDAVKEWDVDFGTTEVRETLSSVLLLAQEIDIALVSAEKYAAADQLWQTLLGATTDPEVSELDHEAYSDLAYAQFVCLNGKSWVAYALEQRKQFVELQKAAFDAAPRDPQQPDHFEWSVREAMHDASVTLLDTTINSQPDLLLQHAAWFTKVAQQDTHNVEKLVEDYNEDLQSPHGYWTIDYLVSRTHYAQLLDILGEQDSASEQAASIHTMLEPIDTSEFRRADRRLLREIRQIIDELLSQK
ncbi:MAG: serine/threonine protein kinase [Rubripirellula sp.]